MEYINDETLNKYFENILKKIGENKVQIDSLKIDDNNYINKIDLGEINRTYNNEQVKEELLEFYRECYNNEEKSLNRIIDKFNQDFTSNFKIENLNKKIEVISQLLDNLKSSEELYEVVLKLDSEENDICKKYWMEEILILKI